MDVASHADVPAGVVLWPGTPALTIIVKLSFELRAPFTPFAAKHEPLCLDRVGPRGALTHPSDFAAFKHLCDVVLVGDDAFRADGQGILAVGPLDKPISPGTRLGPLPTVGRSSDPTDPQVDGRWTRPGFDFELFQAAPRERRIPWPELPVSVAYVRGSERVVTRIASPVVQAALLDDAGWLPAVEIPLRADTIALEPSRGLCHVTFRGVYIEHTPTARKPLIAIGLGGMLSSVGAPTVLRWPRRRLVEPGDLRDPAVFKPSQPSSFVDEPTLSGFERPISTSSHSEMAQARARLLILEETTSITRVVKPAELDEIEETEGILHVARARSPFAPELSRGRLLLEETTSITLTNIVVRDSDRDSLSFEDDELEPEPSVELESYRPAVPRLHDDRDPPSSRTALFVRRPPDTARAFGIDRATFVRVSAALDSSIAAAAGERRSILFQCEQRSLGRSVAGLLTVHEALREVALAVPSLREAVDMATWGDV